MLSVYSQLQELTILFEQRQNARATEMLLDVLESKDPDNKRALRLLAAQSVEEPGLRARAIACFQRAARQNERPCTDSFVLGKLGVMLLEDQRAAEAAEAFGQMLDVEPQSAAGCGYLAEAYRQMGNAAEAGRWHKRALELAQPANRRPDWAAQGDKQLGVTPLE
jgi:tetratricopeptide (TPR) repeat protein